MAVNIQEVRALLQTTREELLHRSNVVATGVGYKVAADGKTNELSVICSVTKKLSKSELGPKDLIPAQLDGIMTDVMPSGIIRALSAHRIPHRPAPGGVSIGHTDISAGTFGCVVRKNGQTYILSNNHVLADSNDALIGDAILQPGPTDGGVNPADQIAELSEFIPLHYIGSELGDSSSCSIANAGANVLNFLANIMGSHARLHAITMRPFAAENLVDAAIAKPLNDQDIMPDIFAIGAIQGIAEGELGMAVKKSGRTTEFTTGEIEQIDVTVDVQYGQNRVARFNDQLMSGAMSEGGDSGSAVLNSDNHMVGLLYAGSTTTTLFNRVQNVFSALNVTL